MSLLKLAPFQTFKEYEFVDPDTKFRYKANSMQDLCARIRLYRAQNDLEELQFLESVVEHWLCTRPDNRGACEKRPPFKRGIIPSIKGGVLILKQMLYNKFADQVVADNRAAICKDCSLNVFPDRGPFVKWADEVAQWAVGERKSKYHEELANCDGCTCLMRSKVFFAGAIKLTEEEKLKMSKANPSCWQVKESQ